MKIELKASGDNASGKSRILKRIKSFLESLGLKVRFLSKDKHTLQISGEFKK